MDALHAGKTALPHRGIYPPYTHIICPQSNFLHTYGVRFFAHGKKEKETWPERCVKCEVRRGCGQNFPPRLGSSFLIRNFVEPLQNISIITTYTRVLEQIVTMPRPKRNLLATIDSTVTPPDTLPSAHRIARITTAAGNNLYNA